MEASLSQYHGITLADIGVTRTWPQLAAYLRWMPPESPLGVELAGGQPRPTLTEQLLAAVHDDLVLLTWMKTKDGAKGRNRPKPTVLPGTPDATRKPRRMVSAAERAAQKARIDALAHGR